MALRPTDDELGRELYHRAPAMQQDDLWTRIPDYKRVEWIAAALWVFELGVAWARATSARPSEPAGSEQRE